MAQSRAQSNEILPEDFLQFLSKNYKTINDIEKKVEQFKNDPWSNFYKKFGCRNWRNLRLCSTKCDSVDSCFSDKDVKKVIKARLKPKMKRLESNERIDVDEGVLGELGIGDHDAPIDFSYLSLNFPMVYFATDLHNTAGEAITPISKLNLHERPVINSKGSRFILEGNRIPLSERTVTDSTAANNKDNGKTMTRVKITQPFEGSSSQSSSSDENSFSFHLFGSDNMREKRSKKKQRDDEGKPSRQLLTLTLPPLHQSVLTLLGQKSGVKSSPRNLIAEHGAALDSANANKAKKLRRHGRKKKDKDLGKESEEKELERPEAADGRGGRGDTEELQETQLSTLHNQNGQNDGSEENDSSVKSPYLSQIKSLRDILDGHLRREQWSQKEMETLNDEIERLSDGLKKYHTDFKAKSISIKEETWLAFPRTCTRVSATFGVPWNSKHLKDLEPVDYLRNYVMITEPRLHLYNLVYQRYRMLENPMGKCITVKSLQRALTEVLGRQFTDEEMMELQKSYLNIDVSYELDSKAFAGICAFCERIYGKYELERCSECVVCSRSKVTDKERCHVKRKNELEEIDLSYLSSKIKLGEASPSLRRVIMGLTNTEFDTE